MKRPLIAHSRIFTYFVLMLIFGATISNSSPKEEVGDYVVLLHGLGRTKMSMKRLEYNLARCGYNVINIGYPSTKFSIEQLANEYLDKIIREQIKDPNRKVHLVTHSLGGILLRYYLTNHVIKNLGRIVMLSPPNKGSEIADIVKEKYLYKKILGPAVQELGTSPKRAPKSLGPIDFELGVIVGDRSLSPHFSRVIPGLDDGTVSVESARIDGMKDFLVVHSSHTFIMQKSEVIDQIIHFLCKGEFCHKKEVPLVVKYSSQPYNSFGRKQRKRN